MQGSHPQHGVASPRDAVEAKTRGAIEIALRADQVDYHVGAGAKRLAAQATIEYHDRFLIELIQNGHDAHPKGEHSGRIEIMLDHEEGEHGVLYVGNGGQPFSHSNFKSICEIGLSDKLPGEAIGNKGLGFKSVLQISSRPEIYSAATDRQGESRFAGYCFSFAEDNQLLKLVGNNARDFDVVRRETATFHLPVPLDEQPPTVQRLADSGLATVIRLPLDRESAREAVVRQIEALRDSGCPLMLFLDRLESLVLEERGGSVGGRRTAMTRRTEPAVIAARDGLALEIVELDDGRRYLRASVRVPAVRIREVVQEAFEAKELDERWLDWNDDAEVSAAVRLDADEETGRLYTYLPMEVEAPFAGHLNAPFYAKLDRRGVNPELALNSLLLDAAAHACGLAALSISEATDRDLAPAAVDFLGWEASEAGRVARSFATSGLDLRTANVLPTLVDEGTGWGSLATSRHWDGSGMSVLVPAAIASTAGVSLLDTSVGAARLTRVLELSAAVLDRAVAPSSREIAEWAERLAAKHVKKRLSITWWNSFYDDLAVALAEDPEALAGRAVILDEEAVLRPAGGFEDDADDARGPTVFFQPRQERGEETDEIDPADEVSIPKSLRRRIVFVHPRLTWLERVGTTRRKKESRKFLEDNALIRPYLAETLLEHVRDLLAQTKSKAVYSDALRFCFRLQRTSGFVERPRLHELQLRVPVEGGWRLARDTVFSSAWPETLGESVERLLDLTGATAPEIQAIRGHLLQSPEDWPFRVDPTEWIDFLRRTGVRDGLWPVANRRRVRSSGYGLSSQLAGRVFGFPETMNEMWDAAITADGQRPSYAGGQYESKTFSYSLPGQADWEELSPQAQIEYASLVVASVGSWPDATFTVRFQRYDVTWRNLDPFDWPSPAAAFLSEARWIPVGAPQAREDVRFLQPRSAWHFSENEFDDSDYARPDYAELVQSRLRRSLDARPAALRRLRAAGLNIWNDPAESSKLIAHLGELVHAGTVGDLHVASLEKAYEQAWESVIDADIPNPVDNVRQLVVRRQGRLATIDLITETSANVDADEIPEPLYVRDGGSRLMDTVLHLSARPILDVGSRIGGLVGDHLRGRLGDRVVPTSVLDVVVLADGEPVALGGLNHPLLSAETSWLEGLIVCVLELKRLAFRRVTDAVRGRVVETLRNTTLLPAETIALRVGSELLDPPHAMRSAVPVADDRHPTVVAVVGEQLSWRELEGIVPAVADLIGYPELTDSIRLAINRLAPANGEDTVASRTGAEIAAALDEPEQRIDSILRSIQGQTRALIEALAPVIVASSGLSAYDAFAEKADAAASDDELASLLAGIEFGRDAKDVVSLARSASGADDLRRALDISLAVFNQALRQLGRSPIHYREEHANALATFIAIHRDRYLDGIRSGFLDAYRDELPLDDYVLLRDALPELEPDPDWLDEFDILPEELMHVHVTERLTELAAPTQRAAAIKLIPLDDVRRANRTNVRTFMDDARRRALAWTEKRGEPTPAGWNDDDFERQVWDRMHVAGIADFEPIETERLLRWVVSEGHWPDSMPATLDLDQLGLTVEELDSARSEQERERAQREFIKGSIEIDGTRHAATRDNYATLVELARASIVDGFLKTAPRFAELADLPPSRPGGGGRTKGAFTASDRGMTDTQKGAVGLIGEVLALEWLKRHYRAATDDCWKSGYRNEILGGLPGNDSAGFDFEVPVGNTTYMFEVKATTGDQTEIELGESEVVVARRHSRTNRYRILHIPNVLDPERRTVFVLPNPFGEAGRDLYRIVGSGLRYQFSLAKP